MYVIRFLGLRSVSHPRTPIASAERVPADRTHNGAMRPGNAIILSRFPVVVNPEFSGFVRIDPGFVHPREHQQAEEIQAVVIVAALALAQGQGPEAPDERVPVHIVLPAAHRRPHRAV